MILIADDQRDVLEALRLLLKGEGLASRCVGSPGEALEVVRSGAPSLVLMDLNYTRDTTSGQEGLDLLAGIRAIDAEVPVVAMTAWGSIELAVKAMQAGAGDFIEKPWDNRRLLSVLRNQLALADSRRQAARLHRENEILKGEDDADFIAGSPPMRALCEQIRKVAPTAANVLVLGENGTGKGVVARLVHANSPRADRPLVKVNMGGIAESVFESEMFGHVRGAFLCADLADHPDRQDRTNRGRRAACRVAVAPCSCPRCHEFLSGKAHLARQPVHRLWPHACDDRAVIANQLDVDCARAAHRSLPVPGL